MQGSERGSDTGLTHLCTGFVEGGHFRRSDIHVEERVQGTLFQVEGVTPGRVGRERNVIHIKKGE